MIDWEYYQATVIPALNTGLLVTAKLIVPSLLAGFMLGVLIGTLRTANSIIIKKLFDIYTTIFRGVPLVVQLFFIYYGLPQLGISFDPMPAAVLGFILCSGAYHSEYIRGALMSIRQGQLKAAKALGFSNLQMLKAIILPQALRYAMPGCGNEFIYLIKYSSLAYITTCNDINAKATSLVKYGFEHIIGVFVVAGIYYLALTTITSFILYAVEKRFAIPGLGKGR